MVFGDMGNRKNSPDVGSGQSVQQGAPLCAPCLPMTGWAVLSYGENPSFLRSGAGDCRQLRDWRYAGARLAAVMGAQSLLMDCFVEARQDLVILRGTSLSVFILLVAPQF